MMLLFQDKLPIGQRVQILLHSHCLLLAILTLILTICGVRSVFVLTLSCLFYTVGLIINIATKLHSKGGINMDINLDKHGFNFC